MSGNTKIAYRSETGRDSKTRIQFITARNQALMSQRDDAAARLTTLRGDVRNIRHAIDTDTVSDAAMVVKVLERMSASERKLVDEITRLNSKMR
jgi:hypothetical protein